MRHTEFGTTLYISDIPFEKFPNKGDLKTAVFMDMIRIVSSQDPEKFRIDLENRTVDYYVTNVGWVRVVYTLNYLPRDRKILLSIFPGWAKPYGSQPRRWTSDQCLNVALEFLQLCDTLGDTFSVNIHSYGTLQFERQYLEDYIDISNWRMSIFNRWETTLKDIFEYKENFKESGMYKVYVSLIKYSKHTNYVFIVFSDENNGILDQLFEKLKPFGEIEGPYPPKLYKVVLESHAPARIAAIFVGEKETIGSLYKDAKKYLDVHGIPSQFISVETITNKFKKYRGVVLNFLIELFTKLGPAKPLTLKPPKSFQDITGVLCLSDIEMGRELQKLFGALFLYVTPQSLEEEIHIYEDINYSITRYGRLYFEDENDLNTLTGYVYHLCGPDAIKMDIIITRRWKIKDIKKLVRNLEANGYQINRIYYVSTRVARFLDESLINDKIKRGKIDYKVPPKYRPYLGKYLHHYIIVSPRAAFIRGATSLKIYPNLSSVYVELVWPYEARLTYEDLEKVLWLIKKRAYRFQEFFVTKTPEPVWIFRTNLRKIYLGEIDEKVKIPLRLLI
ncbi:hypothetical protein [Thermococcus sp.]|uniref:hypothetical protein n=1 Tax=Thermococcus sp. TaxID=35749 RepID=UPI0025E58373|nr:hypothetical protein [Thermococcus sp.]